MYSIKQVCEITGIKSHILRSWEHRYNLFSPVRGKSNIRHYSDADLANLKKILALREEGFRISKIAALTSGELEDLYTQVILNKTEDELLDELLECILSMRECNFCKIWNRETARNGKDSTLENLIFPVIDRLNLLWVNGSLTKIQEKFFTRLLRRKLVSLMEELDMIEPRRPEKFLIYLPQSNNRELSLDLISYSLRKNGYGVFDLGILNKLDEVREALEAIEPTHIYTQLGETFPADLAGRYIDELITLNGIRSIIVTSTPFLLNRVPFNEKVRVFESVKDTIQYINQLN